jgi:hypothetical protein
MVNGSPVRTDSTILSDDVLVSSDRADAERSPGPFLS